MAEQQPHVDNVKALGRKPGVVCIGLHVLNGSWMLALGTMPFRHHKLIWIHVSGNHFASQMRQPRQRRAVETQHPVEAEFDAGEQPGERGQGASVN